MNKPRVASEFDGLPHPIGSLAWLPIGSESTARLVRSGTRSLLPHGSREYTDPLDTGPVVFGPGPVSGFETCHPAARP